MRPHQPGCRPVRPLSESDRLTAEAVAGLADPRRTSQNLAAVRGRPAVVGPGAVLGLQRAAGNAAVAGWLVDREGLGEPLAKPSSVPVHGDVAEHAEYRGKERAAEAWTSLVPGPRDVPVWSGRSGPSGARTPIIVQRWLSNPVGYYGLSSEGDDAYEARKAQGQLAPELNMGVLYEGGQRLDARPSAQLHVEELLIGARVLELSPDLSAADLAGLNRMSSFARYKTSKRATAELYTERAPCHDCRKILDKALQDDDVVSYTVPFGPSAEMTDAMTRLLHNAAVHDVDEAVRRENEVPEADMDAEADAAYDRLIRDRTPPADQQQPLAPPTPAPASPPRMWSPDLSPSYAAPSSPATPSSPLLSWPVPASPVHPPPPSASRQDRRITFDQATLGVTQPIAKPPPEKVRCPRCGHPVTRKGGGKLRAHNIPKTKQRCPGSNVPVTRTGTPKYNLH